MGLSHFDQALWIASTLLAAVVIARILQQHLFVSPLKSFACMLLIVLLRDLILLIPRYYTHAYAVLWECSLPALLAAQIWVALDTLRAVARLYPKMGNLVIRIFLICLIITVIVCCVTLPFELRRLMGDETVLRAFFLVHRSVDAWIGGTLILVAFFFARSPAPLKQPPRNLVLHTVLLSIYFSGYGILFAAENLARLGSVAALERIQVMLVVLLYTAWAIGLSKGGEKSEAWPELEIILFETSKPS